MFPFTSFPRHPTSFPDSLISRELSLYLLRVHHTLLTSDFMLGPGFLSVKQGPKSGSSQMGPYLDASYLSSHSRDFLFSTTNVSDKPRCARRQQRTKVFLSTTAGTFHHKHNFGGLQPLGFPQRQLRVFHPFLAGDLLFVTRLLFPSREKPTPDKSGAPSSKTRGGLSGGPTFLAPGEDLPLSQGGSKILPHDIWDPILCTGPLLGFSPRHLLFAPTLFGGAIFSSHQREVRALFSTPLPPPSCLFSRLFVATRARNHFSARQQCCSLSQPF